MPNVQTCSLLPKTRRSIQPCSSMPQRDAKNALHYNCFKKFETSTRHANYSHEIVRNRKMLYLNFTTSLLKSTIAAFFVRAERYPSEVRLWREKRHSVPSTSAAHCAVLPRRHSKRRENEKKREKEKKQEAGEGFSYGLRPETLPRRSRCPTPRPATARRRCRANFGSSPPLDPDCCRRAALTRRSRARSLRATAPSPPPRSPPGGANNQPPGPC